jgi:methylenetetrahydrofolate reductase (NADPH)
MSGPSSPGAGVERRQGAFARDWSIEATRPSAAELAGLREVLRQGAAIYLSAVPSRPLAELAATAASVRSAGFEPVPHLAARGFATPQALDDFLGQLRREAGVRRVLLVGGDIDPPGAFASALEVLESGLIELNGIEEIGIAGYPDGHPRIAEAALEAALRDKIEAARRARLRVHIVTQFCFEPEHLVAWLKRLRQCAVATPVQVGVIGPTSLPTLLRYAQRCGVRASARGLMRSGFARALVGDANPDALIEALLRTDAEIGDIAPHFFSFGGVLRTARYGRNAADKHFVLSEGAAAR